MGRALFIPRGTEESRSKVRTLGNATISELPKDLGTTKGLERQRAKETFKAGMAHSVTECTSSQARVKGPDLANHKGSRVPFARDTAGKWQ